MRRLWVVTALAAGAVAAFAADDGNLVTPPVGVPGLERPRALLAAGQVRDAERLARAALTIGPDDATYSLWGEIQFRRGNFDEAAKAFTRAADLNPQDARAWWGMGRVEEVRFRQEKARELFAKAHRLDPRDTDIVLSYLDGVTDPGERAALLRNVAALSRAGDPDRAALAVARLQIEQHLAGQPPARLASEYTSYQVPLSGFRPSGAAQNGLIVGVRINGSKALRLVLDTGARGTLIDSRAARNLGLEPIVASHVTGFESHEAAETQLALARSLAIGDLRFQDCLVEVSPGSIAGADGILGAELFEAFQMRIDARRHTMDLTPIAGEALPAPNAIGLRHLLLVKTAVASKEGWFLLDTGAAYSTVARELVPPVMAKGAANLAGVGGALSGAYRLGPLSLGVGGRTLVDMAPVALDLGSLSRREGVEISGVLGYSVLSSRPLTLDLRHGVISFE